MIDKAAIKRAYKEKKHPMGVYRITNMANGKIFIGVSFNIQARINRHKFELSCSSEAIPGLQEDYNTFGEDKIVFDTVDLLEYKEDPEYDYKEDLALLCEMWIEKLQPFGERGYNDGKPFKIY
jgi:hypothetical protein